MEQEVINSIVNFFNAYEGKIIATANSVKIESKNKLIDKRPEKDTEREVLCYVEIDEVSENFPYGVNASEKTYSIIGGCACPCISLNKAFELAEECLVRYKFRRKAYQQMSLFD